MAVERKLERDIDLFLAEEFSVNPPFANWFFEQTNFAGGSYLVTDVWVSKATAEGESDLIVLARDLGQDRNIALFIEDKITAGFMPEQEQRYRLRAEKQRETGDFKAYALVLCAPEVYPASHPEAAAFDDFISYETIAAWLRANGSGPRNEYRATFIETAASAAKNSWTRTDDATTNQFWAAVYDYARSVYPEFEMKEPRFTKGQQWLTLTPSLFPRGNRLIQINVKGTKGFVDLTFLYADAATLNARLGSLLPPGMAIQQTGKSAVIRSYGQPFKVTNDIEAALTAVKECLVRAKALLDFFKQNQVAVLEAGKLAYEAGQKEAVR